MRDQPPHPLMGYAERFRVPVEKPWSRKMQVISFFYNSKIVTVFLWVYPGKPAALLDKCSFRQDS